MDDANYVARKIGAAQKRAIMSLSRDCWGRASDHQAAKRLWYRNDITRLVDHKHKTDNCWRLTEAGEEVKVVLEACCK